MQSLASLFVSLVVVAVVGAGESHARPAAPVDRQATLARAVDHVASAAPLPPDLLLPGALPPSLHAPILFASSLARAPLLVPRATAPLYLRHRALLL